MIGPGRGDVVVRRRQCLLRNKLLQPGLVVLATRSFGTEADVFEQKGEHDLGRALPAGIDEHRSEDGFESVGQYRFLVATAGVVLASTEQQLGADTDPASDLGEGRRVDHRRSEFGQFALREIPIDLEDVLRDSEAENGIAEELEPFVRLGRIGLGAMAPVRESELEQRRVGELIPKIPGEIVGVCRLVQESAPTWLNT